MPVSLTPLSNFWQHFGLPRPVLKEHYLFLLLIVLPHNVIRVYNSWFEVPAVYTFFRLWGYAKGKVLCSPTPEKRSLDKGNIILRSNFLIMQRSPFEFNQSSSWSHRSTESGQHVACLLTSEAISQSQDPQIAICKCRVLIRNSLGKVVKCTF